MGAGLFSPASDVDGAERRIYEVGYHITPITKENDLERHAGAIRSIVEKAGGSFIAEGAPSLTKLAYPITVCEGEKSTEYDRGYFGWLKFEASTETARELSDALAKNPAILRAMVFRTIREDTRARMKAPTLREVKRTDTIKSSPRQMVGKAPAPPVSEEDLEKALRDITSE